MESTAVGSLRTGALSNRRRLPSHGVRERVVLAQADATSIDHPCVLV